MDSPVQIPFQSFVQLKSDDSTAIYLQIVFEFIKAIQLGLLPEGTKLPGTRILCKILSINRNTLIKALQELESQGFIEILPSKGTFILSDQKHDNRTRALAIATKTLPVNSNTFVFNRSSLLENPIEISELSLQFNDGLPDARLIHTDVLARLYVSKLKGQKNRKFWAKVTLESHLDLKKQFSNFLNLTRSLRISELNLMTTTNHEISLYLLFKLLISNGDKVVVGSPSYYLSNMTILDSGAEIISVPVDEEGIDTEYLQRICEQQTIRILYLTSVYHYPNTVLLSAKRRIQILDLAVQYGFIIIEDDYDFDCHFDNNPILPLAAMDTNGCVVYVGSLARSLPAGFGYGFVSAPAPLIIELEKHQNILESAKDVTKEQVLADWIKEGEIHRLLKKNKRIYKERRDYFALLLDEKLKGKVKFRIPARGLALWVEWLEKPNLIKLQKSVPKMDYSSPKTILYQTKNMTATRLGFGSFDKEEMEEVVNILSSAINNLTH